MLSGVNAQVAVKIFGPDLAELRAIAREIETALTPIPGVTDLIREPQVLVERVEVQPRRRDLARQGLTVHDVAETVELALEGEVISRLNQGQFFYPIVIRLAADDRASLQSLRELMIRTQRNELLALGDVADVRMGLTSNNVNRENVSRRVVVSHNVEGRSLGEVVADVDKVLDDIRSTLPAGYSIRISGQFEAQEKAEKVIVVLSALSLLVMFLVLFAHFRSVNLAGQVLLNIPAAFLGAVAMILLTGQTMSIATLVGLVALGGIASRNGILLIDHYLHLMREEGMPFGDEMIVQAGRERIVPVLMTALTSGIALLPLVLAPGQPGRELLYPVGTAIVGGLISSTLLDVLLTPGVFKLFGRKAAEAHIDRYDPSRLASAQRVLEFDDPSPEEEPS
jgi:Cu/Ag efflux pump CusA